MGLSRYLRRVAAWMACFAVLAASLAPSISHALYAAGLSDYAPASPVDRHASHAPQAADSRHDGEHPPDMQSHSAHEHAVHSHHASAPGPDSSGGTDPDSHSSRLHFEHCPFCFTHAGSFGLAPFAAVIAAPNAGASILPVLFYHSPARLFAWTAAQPRAPPEFS
ncbi:MAG TPA: DUF2946 domain-containing protein [Noviherbaspirillum sp.]|jgi:hypothetical protein|uniref:DUF2946 domain-containing protein n=1 Tax=Noviherbaspirillum sp. TaxID=1926288 RepID=UPI002DDD5E21|nr:DUF2946 domain-containing protein [Noviherbaspirillum sp.]HEV2612732.1 DUF2946 domain-containing protein [Noviherbaspirillum sp.]